MHQSDRQPDNRQVQTDGQAKGGCQTEYSYKFNEHPDSREFVAHSARTHTYAHTQANRLTRLDTLTKRWETES